MNVNSALRCILPIAVIGAVAAVVTACSSNDPTGNTPAELAVDIIDAYDKLGPAGARDGVLNLAPPADGLHASDERIRLRKRSHLVHDESIKTTTQLVTHIALFRAADASPHDEQLTTGELTTFIAERFDHDRDGRLGYSEHLEFDRAYPEIPEGTAS